MKDHALIKLLSTFSKDEIKEFGEFISVPYLNNRDVVKKLFALIEKEYPGFDKESINKRTLFGKLYPGKKFNESSLRVITHYLHELAKKFLTYKNLERNKPEYSYHLIGELFERKQFRAIEKIIDKSFEDLNKTDYVADKYYQHRFRLHFEKLFCMTEYHSGNYEKFLPRAEFENVFDNFTLYYYLLSLRLYVNVLNLEIIYKKEFNKEHFKRMFSSFRPEIFKNVPVIQIFYFLVKMLNETDNEEYFYKVKSLVSENIVEINSIDLSEFYVNLLNYCTRKIINGNTKFFRERFEICKEEIKAKTYLVNGVMSPVYYKHVVSTGLKLKEFKWVKDFIIKYKSELNEDSNENNFNYCMALYEFAMNNFDKALTFLSVARYDELYQKIDIKLLQMMIYYETKYYDSLYSSLEAFRHFLQNNKLIPEVRKKSYYSFYRYLKKIVDHDQKKKSKDLMDLKHDLSKDDSVVNREWLMEIVKHSSASLSFRV